MFCGSFLLAKIKPQPHFSFEKMHLVLFLDFKVVELLESVEVLGLLFNVVISSGVRKNSKENPGSLFLACAAQLLGQSGLRWHS